MGPFLAAALRSRVSAIGVALTTASGFVFLFLMVLEILGALRGPYSGIVVFVMLPALFIAGLLLIPIGLWRERSRPRAGAAATAWPTLDLNTVDLRRTLWFVAGATVANLVLLSFATYGAVQYSESQQFCGQACHAVMEPEFVAHQSGLHGRVPCVACHIEPGAQGFIKAKLNGTRQLAHVMSGRYPRPIPSPPQTGIPNVHTSCEQCHWPDRFIGDIIKVVYEYADDEKNTETKTNLQMHVGGPISGMSNGTGIHWHMNRGNRVDFVALDAKLEQIPYVRISTPDGSVREYFSDGVTERDLAGKPRRQMVCIDCHNRPAHRFGSSPERAVDAAIGGGLISAKLPFIRREAVRALKVDYPSQDAALAGIDRQMRAAVQPTLPSNADAALKQAIGVTQSIYRTSVFPAMKIGWGTYPYQIGHVTSDGCFRCHDDKHKTKDGLAIRQDCEMCHAIE
jgi:hypothetical protein